MKLQLSIDYLRPNEFNIKPFFWVDTTIVEDLVQKFLNHDIITIKYLTEHDNFESIENIESVDSYYRNFISKSKDKSCSFYLTKEKNTDSNYVEFYCFHDGIGINLFVDLQLNSNQLSSLRELALDIYKDYCDQFLFGPSFNIRVRYLEFLRNRPERNYEGLEQSAVINFIHPPYFSSPHNLIHREDIKLLELALPSPIVRTEHDGLCSIQWIANLESEKQIQQALMNREDIIYQNLNLEPVDGFNEYGDKSIFHISNLPKAPEGETYFNFYAPSSGNAFKLLTLNENSELDSESQSNIAAYIKNKTLQTGEVVNKIILILPSRNTAIAIEKKVQAIGVYKVLYLDNHANVWDMHPVGKWRN